jgi:ubiquitin-conjugating enzyme E2 H
MFDLCNIFDVFLPQLLCYPNAADPLNTNAAALLKQDKKEYENKIKEYVKRYANNPDFKVGDDDDSDTDDELSEVSELSDDENDEVMEPEDD